MPPNPLSLKIRGRREDPRGSNTSTGPGGPRPSWCCKPIVHVIHVPAIEVRLLQDPNYRSIVAYVKFVSTKFLATEKSTQNTILKLPNHQCNTKRRHKKTLTYNG